MKIQKQIFALLLAAVLILVMSVTAYAHEVPDSSKTGSITVTMTYDGTAVAGGTLILYQVGEIYEDDGNYSFIPTGAFTESGAHLEDISSTTLAPALAAYASAHNLTGTKVTIGGDGTAMASGLPLGLYLVMQTKAADGYEAISPFLVSVPQTVDGTYLYDVDAAPKLSTLTKSTPVTPTTPAKPLERTLPQTGQLNWPVPVLAVLGLCLFLLGFSLRFGKKEISYEA